MKNYSNILRKLENEHNLRRLREVRSDGKYIVYGDRRYLNLASNDYLGIASKGLFQSEFLESIDGEGEFLMSSSSSRLMTGNNQDYFRLEETLSGIYDAMPVLVMGSGYLVNTGVLPALVSKEDLIIADKAVHASIIDGLRLSGCRYERFRHNDMDHLETLLKKADNVDMNVWVVTESVFSMDGDTAPLKDLTALKNRYGFKIYLDEAHAFGLYGPKGAGLASQEVSNKDMDVIIGTFGKAAASYGAYVVTDDLTRQYLVNALRPLIFSTALPPIQLKWTEAVLDKIAGMNTEREYLTRICRIFCPGRTVDTPIMPLMTPGNEQAGLITEKLKEEGYWALPVRHPTVPEGAERIRISLNAAMTVEEITELKRVCSRIGL